MPHENVPDPFFFSTHLVFNKIVVEHLCNISGKKPEIIIIIFFLKRCDWSKSFGQVWLLEHSCELLGA